jgi:hypothetical protein
MRVELEEDTVTMTTDMDARGGVRVLPVISLLIHFDADEEMDASMGQQLSVLRFSAREAWSRMHDAAWQGPVQ